MRVTASRPTRPSPRRILAVEDDAETAELLELHLRDSGWEVEIARDGRAGLQRIQRGGFDAIILDLMLPHVDGLTLCRAVRTQPVYTPVVMLTARGDELDRVVGLEIGADDYLIKPFSIRELVARLRALFRRGDARDDAHPSLPIAIDDLLIDIVKRRVERARREIALTAKEFDLLLFLAQRPGDVFTRSQLLAQVWGYGHEGYGHVVNTHINRLRNKIEHDPSQPGFILTVWGVGYRFRERT